MESTSPAALHAIIAAMHRGVGLACVLGLMVPAVSACGGPSDRERFSLTTPGSDVPIVREIEGSAKPRHGKPTTQELSVIRRWAAALRAGHVNQAAAFFSLPAIVYDGQGAKRRVGNRSGIRAFNRALPCGARFVKARRAPDSFVEATFRLTERPGSGQCGQSTDHLAAVNFLVENHHIVQWLRSG